MQFTTPEITEQETEPPSQQKLEEEQVGEKTQDGLDDVPPDMIPATSQDVEQEKEEEAITFAEEMPTFAGGDAAFQAYLANNIKYPQMEKEMGKTGTVYIYFEVGKDGAISNVQTKKGVNGAPGFSKEAERVIKSMPKWTPGKMNGRSVKVGMTVPVRFELR